MLALAGTGGGILLGLAVVGESFRRSTDDNVSFAGFSANPDALVIERAEALPCPDCADSYGVAARLNAGRAHRMSDAFRELGRVEGGVISSPEPADDYRYGGRFPDPEPEPEPRPLPRLAVPVAPPTAPLPPESPRQKGPDETLESVAAPQ